MCIYRLRAHPWDESKAFHRNLIIPVVLHLALKEIFSRGQFAMQMNWAGLAQKGVEKFVSFFIF